MGPGLGKSQCPRGVRARRIQNSLQAMSGGASGDRPDPQVLSHGHRELQCAYRWRL
jgi:hypothetical protein